MPKSKRDRKIALSKTQKKIGLETKQVSRNICFLACRVSPISFRNSKLVKVCVNRVHYLWLSSLDSRSTCRIFWQKSFQKFNFAVLMI